MALPKFTTTPTPLYQQQPIIKRPNYSEIYLRNFAAAEASMVNSFGKIADRLDKIALEKEKKKEKEIKENREEYEDNKSLDDKIRFAVRSLNTQNRAKAIDMFSKQADGIRDAKQSAKDDETGEEYKTLRVIEKKFFDNIGTFVGAFENIEKHRNYSQTNDMDAIYSNFQRDPKQNAFRKEVISNNGYDLTFGLDEALDIELQYKDDATGETVYMSMEDLATMDLENWGQKKTDWNKKDNHENQLFDKYNSLISGGQAGDPLLKAHFGISTVKIFNQKENYNDKGEKDGSITLTSWDVKKYGDKHKKNITDYVFDKISSEFTPEQIAKIFQDNIAIGGIEKEAEDIAREMIDMSGGKYTDEDFDKLMNGVLTFGPNKIDPSIVRNNRLISDVHEHIKTKAVTWATNRYWNQYYGKDEKPQSEPNITIKRDMDKTAVKEVGQTAFLRNLPSAMAQIKSLKGLSLRRGDATAIQTKLNWINDNFNVPELKNSRTDIEPDEAETARRVEYHIGRGDDPETAAAKASMESLKVFGDDFTYTDKTQDWKIFKMIMNNNYYDDLSDEEAKKLYTGWLLEEGYKGGNGWAMVANELESDHWSSWLLNEKNSLGKIMNDKSKTTITVGGVTYDIGN